MKQLSEAELEKAQLLKAARTAIRLKHALAADREINARLPELEAIIEAAQLSGQTVELTVLELDR